MTGILWYARRTPSTIYATAKAIMQLCPHSPMAPLPDFQSLSPKQKEGIYRHVEEELEPGSRNCAVNRRHYTFAHEALACGATGPNLQPHRDRSYEVFGEEYWVYHPEPSKQKLVPLSRGYHTHVTRFKAMYSELQRTPGWTDLDIFKITYDEYMAFSRQYMAGQITSNPLSPVPNLYASSTDSVALFTKSIKQEPKDFPGYQIA
jgi:hypothetical protein